MKQALLCSFFVLLLLVCAALSQTQAPDAAVLDSGNAYYYWIPKGIRHLFMYSVTEKIRLLAVFGGVSYEAWSQYTDSANGRFLGNSMRRPPEERTLRNKNEAVSYAIHRMYSVWWPVDQKIYDDTLVALGLDSNFTSTTAIVGRTAANAVLAWFNRDGFNQLGDEGGVQYNRVPFSEFNDFYQPVNWPSKVHDPDRWQPLILSDGIYGKLKQQVFIHSFIGDAKTFAANVSEYDVAPQRDTLRRNPFLYKMKALDVLRASRELDDKQKMVAEYFDNKLHLFAAVRYMNTLLGNGVEKLDDTILHTMLYHTGMLDALITVWKLKRKYDAVRPITAIRWLFANTTVRAYGGPYQGTVTMRGGEWDSYLRTDAFPEYPSGTSCMCAIVAQLSRRRFGSDVLNMTVDFVTGSSVVENGMTPTNNLTITWQTFSRWADDCSQSRVWGGVHFQQAVDESKILCKDIADKVFDKFVAELSANEMPHY